MSQTRQVFQDDQYPDPLNIISQMSIDPSSVRMFGNLSGGLSEWLRTTTVERCGTCSIWYQDDGDADGYTNLAVFSAPTATGDSLLVPGTADTDANLTLFGAAVGQCLHTYANYAAPAADGTGPERKRYF